MSDDHCQINKNSLHLVYYLFEPEEIPAFLDPQFNTLNSMTRSLSTLATLILPRIVRFQCVRKPTEVCTSLRIIFENMETLLPFMELQNIVYILSKFLLNIVYILSKFLLNNSILKN